MLYFRNEKENGRYEFIPFYLGCAYLHCSHCGKMIQVDDLSEYLSEFQTGDDRTFFYDMCDDCFEEQCCREEKYLENHRSDYGK